MGQYLKRERESRSISLEELSRSTRIGLPYLQALERDDFVFITQREFILGFLKGYARYLGLEVEEVLRRYRIQSELASRQEKFHQIPLFSNLPETPEEVLERKPDSPEVSISREKRRFSWKIYLQIAIVLGALGLSIYFYQLSKKTADPSPNPTPGVHPSVKGKLENVSPKEKTGQDKERR